MNGRIAIVVGVVMSLCVAVSAHGQVISLSEANPAYTYDFGAKLAADPNAVVTGSGSYGIFRGPEFHNGYDYNVTGYVFWNGHGTLSYTFVSNEPGKLIETLTLVGWVNFAEGADANITISCLPEGGQEQTKLFQENPGKWMTTDLTWTFDHINAPSVTITYTLDRPDDSNGWKMIMFGVTRPVDQGSGAVGEAYGMTVFSATATFAPVPEPMTMSLLAVGGVALLRRRGR